MQGASATRSRRPTRCARDLTSSSLQGVCYKWEFVDVLAQIIALNTPLGAYQDRHTRFPSVWEVTNEPLEVPYFHHTRPKSRVLRWQRRHQSHAASII